MTTRRSTVLSEQANEELDELRMWLCFGSRKEVLEWLIREVLQNEQRKEEERRRWKV
jgi:metal-responsive CopG/Arc/MetJ family transcriptional regulator